MLGSLPRGLSLGRRRASLTLIVMAGLVSVAVGSAMPAAGEPVLPEKVVPLVVTSRVVANFQASNPQRRRFGQLEFRGGLVMTGNNAAFGGWSGIAIEPDGKRFLAISDEGAWMSGEIVYKDRAPAGIIKAKIGPIRALRGRQLDKKRDLDAEAVRLKDGTLARGTVLVGFERNHRIGEFPVVDGEIASPTRYLPLPADARRMSANKGFEAVAVMKGGPFKGSVVALSERYPGTTTHHRGWIWVNGVAKPLWIEDIGGFDLTDATSTDGGDLLLLERRFRWTEGVKMRIRRFTAGAIRPDARLKGEIVIEADLASEIDNMEGLALHHTPAGETVLTLVSDDNFNTFLQRNLLLQFTLHGPREASQTR